MKDIFGYKIYKILHYFKRLKFIRWTENKRNYKLASHENNQNLTRKTKRKENKFLSHAENIIRNKREKQPKTEYIREFNMTVSNWQIAAKIFQISYGNKCTISPVVHDFNYA